MIYILLFIIALLIYMAISLLVAGIAGLAVCDSHSGELSQKERDISIILGALWPVSLPYMCFVAVIYQPLVAIIKAAKRLTKGDY
ncbi:hypothetical protein oldone_13 [Pseudomonas phage oldone]|nr:hypothetical protein oldone_13 [Pseudomonas phage oldone]